MSQIGHSAAGTSPGAAFFVGVLWEITPCRIGTSEAREILDRLLTGGGEGNDIERLQQLAAILKQTSLCGLGTSASKPIETALCRFRETFEILLP